MSDGPGSPRAVIEAVVAGIGPASEAQAFGVEQRLAGRLARDHSLGTVGALAARLAAARHSPHPRVADKAIVVVAADHGIADPGVDLGEHAPTVVALRHIAGGEAAVNAAARSAGAALVLVDAGVRGAARRDLGAGVIRLRHGDGTADITAGAAMTPIDAVQCVQTGLALTMSLADEGLDVCALGQVGAGAEPVTGAVIAALTGAAATDFGDDTAVIEAALSAGLPGTPLEVLAAVGGFDLGVLAGLILGAAAINVPVVLDDHATWAAALIAARLQPAVAGYLIAAHTGGSPGHRRALEALGLTPLFDLGLAHGEGTGAALALPLLDSAAGLLAR
jgi:nicotinate-nucleotide--dimethylbenzimidazole phosphoribosyltransferase